MNPQEQARRKRRGGKEAIVSLRGEEGKRGTQYSPERGKRSEKGVACTARESLHRIPITIGRGGGSIALSGEEATPAEAHIAWI